MQSPSSNPERDAEFAQLILKDKERRRELSMYPEDTSRKRLPRKVFVLLQLTILFLIIFGLVILFHIH